MPCAAGAVERQRAGLSADHLQPAPNMLLVDDVRERMFQSAAGARKILKRPAQLMPIARVISC